MKKAFWLMAMGAAGCAAMAAGLGYAASKKPAPAPVVQAKGTVR